MKCFPFHFLISILLICIGFLLISFNPARIFADQPESLSQHAQLVETGSDLYKKYCSICHGPDGGGYQADRATAIGNQDFLVSADDEYIIQAILRGRPGTAMSAWGVSRGGTLSRKEAETILAFIRTWQKEPSVDLNETAAGGDYKNGADLFERWCAACHGKYGSGGKAVKLDNPIFQQTASDGFLRYAIENGRRNTDMTAYKKTLSPADIEDVVSYIRSFNSVSVSEDKYPVNKKKLSKLIREKAVLNPGNPPAVFSLIDDRFVASDDVISAYKSLKSFIIIDARPGSDYLRSHIKGAISIPFYNIESAVNLLPKDIWIIAYCACPHALSGKAFDTLKAANYDKVAILNEGFLDWVEKAYPTASAIPQHPATD